VAECPAYALGQTVTQWAISFPTGSWIEKGRRGSRTLPPQVREAPLSEDVSDVCFLLPPPPSAVRTEGAPARAVTFFREYLQWLDTCDARPPGTGHARTSTIQSTQYPHLSVGSGANHGTNEIMALIAFLMRPSRTI